MKVELTFLRTRVARRMLLLFLLCAVVPVIVLGGVSYLTVKTRLDAARRAQLRGDTKVAGLLVLAGLEKLTNRLQIPNLASGASSDSATTQDTMAFGAAFASVAIEREPGALAPISGRMDAVPILTAAQNNRLEQGRPALITTSGNRDRGVFIVVVSPVHDARGYPRIWGYQTVQRVIDGIDAAPVGTTLCLRDLHGPLTCDGLPADAKTVAGRSGEGMWTQDGVTMASSAWHIFLNFEFAAPEWTVILSAPRALTYMPLTDFARTIMLILVFAVVLVFTVSHVQIRRRMTPLADLEAGTRRLRDGDFSSRVVIESDDEFQSLGTAFNQMATDLERQFTTLSALHRIDHAALQDHSAGAIAAAALHGAPELLGADVVAVAAAGPADTTAWRFDVVTPFEPSSRLADVELSAGDIAELACSGGHILVTASEAWPAYCGTLGAQACRELILFPIQGQRGPIGVLIVGLRGASAQHADVLTTGRQLAEQLALGLSNVSLLEELDSLSLGALTALARTIDASSPWTAGHSERVTQGAVEIAQRLGFSAADIARLQQGSLLHDIGKIGVPSAILDKAGPLNEAELAVMRSHPVIGARIVESVRAFRDLVPLVLHHHELLDGTGYPAGLCGDEIPDLVRVLTVADVFDAITSDRPYRKGLAAESALAILTNGVGTKFDGRAVAALRDMVAADWMSAAAMGQPSAVVLSSWDEQTLMGVDRAERAA